ncbi:MAG: extracellular solute-binding protein [Anaerolineales bacterium]
MKKKLFFSILMIMALVASPLFLGACAAPTPEPTEEPTEGVVEEPTEEAVEEPTKEPTVKPAEKPEEVTLTVWFLSGSPEEIGLMQELSDQFAEDHPGVTIDFSSYGFDDMNNTLRLALDGGTGPDVAYTSPGPSHGGQYAKAGHLVNLSPSAEEYGWINKFSESILLYNNESLDEIYGAGFDMVSVGVFYNEELFNDLGLTEPETFEDFENIHAEIKDAGYIPIAVGGLDGWPLAHVWDQLLHAIAPIKKIEAVESGDSDASYADPDFVKAAEILDRWIEEGYFQDNMLATSYPDGNNLFINGEAAINIGGTWNNSTFSVQPDFTARFFAFPRVDESIEWHMGGFTPNNAWMVPVYSEHQDLALEYVAFMMGPEVAKAKWNAGDIVGYQFDTIPDPVSPLQADVYSAMQKTGPGYYLGNYSSEVQAAIWAALQAIASGRKSPEEAMQSIDQVYQAVVGE